MSHLKRQSAPKHWPIIRKGTKFVVKPNFKTSEGVPILVILRDMLKVAQNRREVKKALHEKKVFLNGKPVKDEKHSALLFDTITLVPSKSNYRLTLSESGKFQLEKIKETESKKKIAKIIDKRMLKGKRMQINLSDGRNLISEKKCHVNDSVLIDLEKKKIEDFFPLKEKSKIIVFEGKHIGEKGIVEKISKENKMVEAKIGENKVNILIKQLMVIE